MLPAMLGGNEQQQQLIWSDKAKGGYRKTKHPEELEQERAPHVGDRISVHWPEEGVRARGTISTSR